MSVQTSYSRDFSEAFAGLLGDIRPNTIVTGIAEGTVGFGLGVVAGTNSDQVKVVNASTDTLRGISVHQHVEQSTAGAQDATYDDEDAVGVMTKGTVWMPVETTTADPSVDDAAYINVAVTAEKGSVTEVSTGNLATGGKIRKLATDPAGLAIALVEINLP